MHRWEDFRYNYLFLLPIFPPSSHSIVVFFPVGLSSLMRHFQQVLWGVEVSKCRIDDERLTGKKTQ